MLVRAVGVAPLWKDSAALCIVAARVLVWGDFKVCGGDVAVRLSRARGGYFCDVVDEKVVDVRS